MNVKRIKPIAWALTALMLALALLAAGAGYAGGPPPEPAEAGDGSLQVTGYTVQKDGQAFTGKIRKNDVVTIVLRVLDERLKEPAPVPPASPRATVNTGSFSIPRQSNVSYGALAYSAAGCAYRITFKDLKYTGTGNLFECNISYTNVAPPVPMQTASLTLNQCVEYVASEPGPEPVPEPAPEPAPAPEPGPSPPDVTVKGTGFVLMDARYGDGEPIFAGKVFVLSAVILATNGTYAVENVSASFSPPEELTFADGSSVVYIGTMSPGASAPVAMALLPGANIQEGSYTIGIDVSGVNQNTGDPVSAHMTVSMPILQPERFEIFNTMLPTDLMTGMDTGMGYGSVTLVNQGRGAVSNVSFEITGEGLSLEDGKMYIGNVNGGEQKAADFNLLASVPGMIDALVVIAYENVRGEQKTLEHPFSINVMDGGEGGFVDPGWPEGEPGLDGPGWPGEGDARQGPPALLWIAIIAGAAAAAIALLIRRHRKKRKAAEAALDDFPDDDD